MPRFHGVHAQWTHDKYEAASRILLPDEARASQRGTPPRHHEFGNARSDHPHLQIEPRAPVKALRPPRARKSNDPVLRPVQKFLPTTLYDSPINFRSSFPYKL